jgi:hypothetical protein
MNPKDYEFKSGFLKKSSFNYMWISTGIAKKTIFNKRYQNFTKSIFQGFFNQLANLFEKISMIIS